MIPICIQKASFKLVKSRLLYFCWIFSFATAFIQAQHVYPLKTSSEKWADSILATLNFEQLIAQKLMVPAWTRDANLSKEVMEAVEQYQVGGVIFFQGTPQTHVMAVNYLQQQAKIPLLVGMDAEWGPAMRLDHVPKYPYPLSIASTQSTRYSFDIGLSQGRMLRALGVHINFAPVVDININPNNPIIGFRSFGEQAQEVAKLAKAFNNGLEFSGVWGCAKHFPGHGNTMADSHKELPLVDHDKKSFQKELAPFESLIDADVKSIMVAHLKIPYLDDRPQMPSSLSRRVVHDLLRVKLNFQGLIITDAMNMKGVSAHYQAEEAILKAIQAGNDILCFVDNVPQIMANCRSWLDSCWIDSAEIAASVRRILIAKHQTKITEPLDASRIQPILEREYERFIDRQVTLPDLPFTSFPISQEKEIQAASKHLCLLSKSPQNSLPWSPNQLDTVSLIIFGDRINEAFLQRVKQFHQTQIIWAQSYANADTLLEKLLTLNGKLVFFHSAQRMWGNQTRRLPESLMTVLSQLPAHKPAVFIHTGNVYALQELETSIPVILGMETGESYQLAAVDALFGYRAIKGKLAVKISDFWNETDRNTKEWYQPLTMEAPESLGFHCNEYGSLNAIMDSVILSGAAPSAQLLVLKNGKIAYQISKGKQYQSSKDVDVHTIYDIASITKTAAMTMAFMHLYETEDIDLEEPIKSYWPEIAESPWASVPIAHFLTHRSGLPPFLPLEQKLRKNGLLPVSDSMYEAHAQNRTWGDSLLIPAAVSDTVWLWIRQTSPKNKKKKREVQPYIYSDLNAIILGKFIEYRSKCNLSQLCDSLFYRPMGLFHTGFFPQERGLQDKVMPTQNDVKASRKLIWSQVHDPSSYFLGSCAGNAGLFSSAYDLSRWMLMLSNGGVLDQKRYFKKETIQRFTRTWDLGSNHRGLGFDKPNGYPNNLKDTTIKGSNIFDAAPMSIFGHAGFTGTWAWADRDNQLVFIFLSNRTFPDDRQNLLAKKGYRGKLMEIVYRSLKYDE